MSDPHSPRPQTAELEPSDYLCPDCGHHIHRPQPCQWIFGAGEHPRPCPCPADPHSPRPESKSVTREALAAALEPFMNERGQYTGITPDRLFDALPAADPAASAEAAWEVLRADRAAVRDAFSEIVDSENSRAVRDVAVGWLDAAFAVVVPAAIRSAGTPPASRDGARAPLIDLVAAGLCDGPTNPIPWHERTELQKQVSGFRAQAVRLIEVALRATPPEPVGGREARTLLGYLWTATGKDGKTTPESLFDYDDMLAVDIRSALQASPPTGVSDGVALDDQCPERCLGVVGHAGPHQTSDYEPDTLGAAWAAAEAALPAGWGIGIEPSARGYEAGAGRNQWAVWSGMAHPSPAAALRALAQRLAREQADSEPHQPDPRGGGAG